MKMIWLRLDTAHICKGCEHLEFLLRRDTTSQNMLESLINAFQKKIFNLYSYNSSKISYMWVRK